jgi:hypothetical protein
MFRTELIRVVHGCFGKILVGIFAEGVRRGQLRAFRPGLL